MEDAQKLWRACIAQNWDVVRVHGWRVPETSSEDIAIYEEPLFAQHVPNTLGLKEAYEEFIQKRLQEAGA